MNLAAKISRFLRYIPKEESPEVAFYVIHDNKLHYSGTKTICTLDGFIPDISAVVTYRDLMSISTLQDPVAERDGAAITVKDKTTSWTIYATEPKPEMIHTQQHPSTNYQKMSPAIAKARALFGFRRPDMQLDALNINGIGYVAAVSPSLVLSLVDKNETISEINISGSSNVIESIVTNNADVQFDSKNMYIRDNVGNSTIYVTTKYAQSRVMDKVKVFIEKVHNGGFEVGTIVTCDVPYDELRNFAGLVEKMESPTETTAEVADNELIMSVSEMHGRALRKSVSAKTSVNKITFRTGVIATKILQFLLSASDGKPQNTDIRITVMPETGFCILNPVVDSKRIAEVASITRVHIGTK